MATPGRPKNERKRRTTNPLPADRANDAPRVSETDIAIRAFGYYCERGFQHGADVEDWLRAERELTLSRKTGRRQIAR
jgi:hypothetical protein